MKKELTKFGRYAVNSFYNRGYTGAIIAGDFAKGKTSTAIKLAREILQHIYGYDEITAYKEVLNHILFTLDDVIGATDILQTEEHWKSMKPQEVLQEKYDIRKPVYIWDDAGVHGSSLKQVFDKSDAYELQSNYDTIRDVCSCMIMTVPEDEELMKFLRRYRSNYFVEIIGVSGGNKYDRILEFYKYERDNRTGNKKRKLKWRTKKPFSVHLENWVYGEYDRMRTIAKIRNAQRYKKKRKERESKAKYYDLRREYLKIKMEKELAEMKQGQ